MDESEEFDLEENIQLGKIDGITINNMNNEVDNAAEITPNMEFNIMVIGKEGKYII